VSEALPARVESVEARERKAGPAPVAFVPGRRKGPGRWLVPVGLVVLAAGLGTWYFTRHRTDDKRHFLTVTADRGPLEEVVTATGTLEAVETVEVGALVSGRVLKVGAEEDATVKKGQLLALIDPEPYRAKVEQQSAQLAIAEAAVEKAKLDRRRAERERDRFSSLGERGAMGIAEVDNAESQVLLLRSGEKSAEAEVLRARALLRSARLDLERTSIFSPIDGIVLHRAVEVGQSFTSNFQSPTLFTIARDLKDMQVLGAIDEADVGRVVEGQEVRFTVDAHPAEEFVGKIWQIRRAPTVTSNVVTYEAKIRVQNQERKLWPGMTATVRIVTARKADVLRVPNASLRFKAPKDLWEAVGKGGSKEAGKAARKLTRIVWKLSQGKPVPVEVEIGIADDEFTEIARGELAIGDTLVAEILGAEPKKSSGGRRSRW
jgi:HlyD family secretion protein